MARFGLNAARGRRAPGLLRSRHAGRRNVAGAGPDARSEHYTGGARRRPEGRRLPPDERSATRCRPSPSRSSCWASATSPSTRRFRPAATELAPEARGTAVALFAFFLFVGGAIGSALFGPLVDYGWHRLFLADLRGEPRWCWGRCAVRLLGAAPVGSPDRRRAEVRPSPSAIRSAGRRAPRHEEVEVAALGRLEDPLAEQSPVAPGRQGRRARARQPAAARSPRRARGDRGVAPRCRAGSRRRRAPARAGRPPPPRGATWRTTVPPAVPLIRASEMRTMSRTPAARASSGSGASPPPASRVRLPAPRSGGRGRSRGDGRGRIVDARREVREIAEHAGAAAVTEERRASRRTPSAPRRPGARLPRRMASRPPP